MLLPQLLPVNGLGSPKMEIGQLSDPATYGQCLYQSHTQARHSHTSKGNAHAYKRKGIVYENVAYLVQHLLLVEALYSA